MVFRRAEPLTHSLWAENPTEVGDRHEPAWAAALDMMAFEMPHFIMERRMMLRIKALAETKAQSL